MSMIECDKSVTFGCDFLMYFVVESTPLVRKGVNQIVVIIAFCIAENIDRVYFGLRLWLRLLPLSIVLSVLWLFCNMFFLRNVVDPCIRCMRIVQLVQI